MVDEKELKEIEELEERVKELEQETEKLTGIEAPKEEKEEEVTEPREVQCAICQRWVDKELAKWVDMEKVWICRECWAMSVPEMMRETMQGWR